MSENFYELEGFKEGEYVRVTYTDKPDVVGTLECILSGSDNQDDGYVQAFVSHDSVSYPRMIEDGPDALAEHAFLTITKEPT